MAPKKRPGEEETEDDGLFTEAQLAQINDLITSKSNATVSALLQRKLDGAVKSQLEGPLAEFRTLLEGFKPAAPSGGGDSGKKPEGDGGKSNDPHPDVVAMKRRVEVMEAERKQERTNARAAKRDATLTQIATAAGVDKMRVRGVVKLLGADVAFDDKTDEMKMKIARNGFDEDVDVETGAAEFFKTDEGKAYLAPTQPVRPGGQQRTTAASVVARPGGAAISNAPDRGAKAAKNEKITEAHSALADAIGELVGGGSVGIG